eukprot:s29_g34.t1
MAWPIDMSPYGSLSACRRHYGVSAELWECFIQAAGDPGEDYRLLAALPPNAVAATIEATVLPSGQSISVVQAAQLGLVYRLAKRKLHVDSGLDLALWQDPDPWQQVQTPSQPAPAEDTLDQTKGGERKLKLSTILDQGDETEFTVAPESQKQVWLQVYANVTGDLPMEQEDATTAQVSAIQKKLQMGQPPFADFAVFQPYGRKLKSSAHMWQWRGDTTLESYPAPRISLNGSHPIEYIGQLSSCSRSSAWPRRCPTRTSSSPWTAPTRGVGTWWCKRTSLRARNTCCACGHRVPGPHLPGVLAPGGASGRACALGTPAAHAGVLGHGDRAGHEGSEPVDQGESLGMPLQASHQRRWLLGRAGTRTCKCVACPWVEGQAFDSCRGFDSHRSSGRDSIHQARDGGAEDEPGSSKEIQQCPQEGCQEKATRGGEEQRHEGKGQGQRQRKATLLCLEQQQWRMWWPTTRIRLPRKSGKRAQVHDLWKSRPPGPSMLSERKLIFHLQKDWIKAQNRCREFENETKASWAVPIWVCAGSASGSKKEETKQESSEKSSSEERPTKKRRTEDDVQKDDKSKEAKAVINGKLMSLKEYVMRRRFHFLHLYAGADDPLGQAIRNQAKNRKMKVTVVSCDIESGADLLRKEPYESLLEQARASHWDGVHSGFPCTTFSRLRWRKAEGYPGPVRSKQHPYGLPDLSDRRRAEADEGTLHVSRTVHLEEAILNSRPGDTFKPVATVENPPPSDHPQHLSAWELPELAGLFDRHNFTLAEFTTCRFQSQIPPGERNYKPQMFGGNLPGLSSLRGVCMCGEGVGHVSIVGKEKSAASARYPDELCEAYAILLIGQFERMAKAEFFEQRSKDLASEVAELRKRSTKQEPARSRTPLARRKYKERVKEEETEGERQEKGAASKSRAEPGRGSAASSTTSKAKAVPKKEEDTSGSSTDEEDDTEEHTEPKDLGTSRKGSAKSLEWKGGRGKFGMLRESSAQAADPAKLNYVGGMRNPVDTVEGMSAAQNLGLRIFASWERLTRTNVVAMETAANYGTKDCQLCPTLVEQWRAELRKVVGSRGKLKANLKSRTLGGGRQTLGINLPIPARGVFPAADMEDETETMADAVSQLERGTISNYSSVTDNLEDTKAEVERLESLGFLLKIDRKNLEKEFSQGTISKLAIIVKERPDKTKKRRLIIDLRRSGGNSKAKLKEKLVLPRASDAVRTLRQMVKMKPEPTAQEMTERWSREMVLVDVSDAFPHLAVHHQELEHCLTPGLAEDEFYLFRSLLFGYKTAPLLWSRVAAWVARFLQSCVPVHEGQHQVYLDDSFWVLQGPLNRRNVVLGFVLYSMAALGFSISVQKGERGAAVTWMGIEFRLISRNELLMTLPEKFLADLQGKLEAWESKGMAATKDLRTVCGKVSWLSGVLPRTKWMLRVFYAVLAHREAEVKGGAEEERRVRREDPRPKEHMFPIKRLEGARLALLEYLKVTKERPTRKISLSSHNRARVNINTDASPEGLGAVLIINGQVIDVLASAVTEQDSKDLDFELGSSASQGVVEGLALLVALRQWGAKLAGMSVDLTVQSDSVTALAMTQKRSAATPTLNFLGAVMGIWMEAYRVEDVKLLHIPGVANKVADWLSRPSKWKSTEKPAELGDVTISGCVDRSGEFYPPPPPGRKPELWGASTGEADTGPWHTLFT